MIRNTDMYAGGFQFTTVQYGTEAVQHFGSLTIEKSIETSCKYPCNGELKLSVGFRTGAFCVRPRFQRRSLLPVGQ